MKKKAIKHKKEEAVPGVCPVCEGTGRHKPDQTCPNCAGTGKA